MWPWTDALMPIVSLQPYLWFYIHLLLLIILLRRKAVSVIYPERNTRTLTFLHCLVYAFLSYPLFRALHVASHYRAFAGWKEEVIMEDIRQKCILKTEKTIYTQNENSALSECSYLLLNSLLILFYTLPELLNARQSGRCRRVNRIFILSVVIK